MTESRNNGISVSGSHTGIVADNMILDYGTDDGTADIASGIAFNRHYGDTPQTMASEVTVSGNCLRRTPRTANAGADLWAQEETGLIHDRGNVAVGRALTRRGGTASFKGMPG